MRLAIDPLLSKLLLCFSMNFPKTKSIQSCNNVCCMLNNPLPNWLQHLTTINCAESISRLPIEKRYFRQNTLGLRRLLLRLKLSAHYYDKSHKRLRCTQLREMRWNRVKSSLNTLPDCYGTKFFMRTFSLQCGSRNALHNRSIMFACLRQVLK